MLRNGTIPAQKEKLALISVSTITQNGGSFMWPPTVNSWLIRFSTLTPCLLQANQYRQNQQY